MCDRNFVSGLLVLLLAISGVIIPMPAQAGSQILVNYYDDAVNGSLFRGKCTDQKLPTAVPSFAGSSNTGPNSLLVNFNTCNGKWGKVGFVSPASPYAYPANAQIEFDYYFNNYNADVHPIYVSLDKHYGAHVLLRNYIPANAPARKWINVKIPLANFPSNKKSTVKGFVFMSSSASNHTFLVDNAMLSIPIGNINPNASHVKATIDSSDSSQAIRFISPYIYGINDHESNQNMNEFTFRRFGGNRWSTYNWENNASNAGDDYSHLSDGYLGFSTPQGDTNLPGEVVRRNIIRAHSKNEAALITVPINGHVAADKAGAVTPAQVNTRFHDAPARKNGSLVLSPNLNDNVVYQDEYVNFVDTRFPGKSEYPKPGATYDRIFYSLDNEPSLWDETHPLIHPGALTYQELMDKTIEYAEMIKDEAPNSWTFGPVLFGYSAMHRLKDAPDANGQSFMEYYLSQLKDYADTHNGKRLVDVIDLHWYSEAESAAGQRVTENHPLTANFFKSRVDSTLSLWHPAYKENSWIVNQVLDGPIELFVDLQAKINQYVPGTRMALTEYNFGGADNISGAITQADALGVFGQRGVFAAALWPLEDRTDDFDFQYAAFKLFRNYDGRNSTFGNKSIKAISSNVLKSTVYSSVFFHEPDAIKVVVTNKENKNNTLGIDINHPGGATFDKASVYIIKGDSPNIVSGGIIPVDSENEALYDMPPRSVSLLVFQK